MGLLHLGTFYNKEELDVVLCGWLRKKTPDLCSGGIFKQMLHRA
jgi:hypothetical protein